MLNFLEIDLNSRRNTEYPKWIESNGPIVDTASVNIGDFDRNQPIICRIAIAEALIPGSVNATSGLCQATWKGQVVTSMSTEYLSGPIKRLVWAESNRGNIPTGAVIGGVTSDGVKIYIIRIRKDANSKDFLGGKIIKGDKQGSVIKDGKEFTTPTYEVLCLQTIIFP